MDTSKHSEFQNAINVFRNSVINKKIERNFSVESVKYLDDIIETTFKDGKFQSQDGTFIQYSGLLLFGISGYLSEVILRNTSNAKLEFDDNNENWYVDFKVNSENGWIIQPGIRVRKRAYQGSEFELYVYALSVIKYFNTAKDETRPKNTYTSEVYLRDNPKQESKKAWWKFW